MHKQILYLDSDQVSYIVKSEYPRIEGAGNGKQLYEIGFKHSDRILQFETPGDFDKLVDQLVAGLLGRPVP